MAVRVYLTELIGAEIYQTIELPLVTVFVLFSLIVVMLIRFLILRPLGEMLRLAEAHHSVDESYRIVVRHGRGEFERLGLIFNKLANQIAERKTQDLIPLRQNR